jgi:hypothetical protein
MLRPTILLLFQFLDYVSISKSNKRISFLSLELNLRHDKNLIRISISLILVLVLLSKIVLILSYVSFHKHLQTILKLHLRLVRVPQFGNRLFRQINN